MTSTPGNAAKNEDRHRGRHAEWPSEIPSLGWRDILLRVWDKVWQDNIMIIAAGVAFFGFLAIPSALTALVALYGLMFNVHDVQQQVAATAGLLPKDATTVLASLLQSLTEHSNSTLSTSFAISLLVAIWSARSGVATLMTAVNIAYREKEKRSLFRFELVALIMTIAGVILAIISLALIAILPAIINILPLGAFGKTLASVVRWPILIALTMVALATIYRFSPSRRGAKWRWVTWGSVIATVLWVIVSALFSIYVGQFASYDKTYGSMGAIVVFMLWLWLTSLAVLVGAELNAEIEHQTMRDSTIGPEKPMGTRGAVVADTIGEQR